MGKDREGSIEKVTTWNLQRIFCEAGFIYYEVKIVFHIRVSYVFNGCGLKACKM